MSPGSWTLCFYPHSWLETEETQDFFPTFMDFRKLKDYFVANIFFESVSFFLRKFIFHKLFQLPYMHAFKIFDAKTSLSFYKKCVWEAERETECSRPVVHSPNAHKALGSAHHTIQASHTVNRNPVELSPLPSRVSVSTKVELGAGARRYTLVPWCGRYVLNFLHASS